LTAAVPTLDGCILNIFRAKWTLLHLSVIDSRGRLLQLFTKTHGEILLLALRDSADNDGMDLTNADCALGRLVWNLWSLEWMLRNVLYVLKHAPHTDMSHPEGLFAATTGDRFPQNALTSYASLGPLIDAYNETAKLPIDRSLVTLRETLAHVRALAKDFASQHFVLTKFTRPDGNGTVTAETRYELTFDWMNEQIVRVGDALDSVTVRYRELGGL